MSETSVIDPGKVEAYLATRYCIAAAPQDIVLVIGQRSDDLATLFAQRRVDCGAFITAFNPRGALQSDEANVQAHGLLESILRECDHEIIEGEGVGAAGDWPPERSWFALGLALEQARVIGTRFDQDAIVWVGADAVPQLILLR